MSHSEHYRRLRKTGQTLATAIEAAASAHGLDKHDLEMRELGRVQELCRRLEQQAEDRRVSIEAGEAK